MAVLDAPALETLQEGKDVERLLGKVVNVEELHSADLLASHGLKGEVLRDAMADVDSTTFTGVGEGQGLVVEDPGRLALGEVLGEAKLF